jgi:hypothetical protein
VEGSRVVVGGTKVKLFSEYIGTAIRQHGRGGKNLKRQHS